MPDQPIGPSELIAFLKQLLETAPPTASAPFLDTLVNAQALLDRLEPPESKPGPLMSIAYLNLTVMAHQLLQGAGIQTLGELMKHSEHSLAKIPSMGCKSVKVILEALKPYGGSRPLLHRQAKVGCINVWSRVCRSCRTKRHRFLPIPAH